MPLWNGRLWLLLGLTAALAFGCATARPQYRVSIPTLTMTPRLVEHEGERFIVLRFTDYAGLVRELKAACLALGGARQDCQAD